MVKERAESRALMSANNANLDYKEIDQLDNLV